MKIKLMVLCLWVSFLMPASALADMRIFAAKASDFFFDETKTIYNNLLVEAPPVLSSEEAKQKYKELLKDSNTVKTVKVDLNDDHISGLGIRLLKEKADEIEKGEIIVEPATSIILENDEFRCTHVRNIVFLQGLTQQKIVSGKYYEKLVDRTYAMTPKYALLRTIYTCFDLR